MLNSSYALRFMKAMNTSSWLPHEAWERSPSLLDTKMSAFPSITHCGETSIYPLLVTLWILSPPAAETMPMSL